MVLCPWFGKCNRPITITSETTRCQQPHGLPIFYAFYSKPRDNNGTTATMFSTKHNQTESRIKPWTPKYAYNMIEAKTHYPKHPRPYSTSRWIAHLASHIMKNNNG